MTIERTRTEREGDYMRQKYYEILVQLAEIAEEYGENNYSVRNCDLGQSHLKTEKTKQMKLVLAFSKYLVGYWTRERTISTINRRLHHI